MKALVIDDSATMRKMVSLTLQSVGYQVVEGENGQEGLDSLQANDHFQVIITDLNMPVMDGFTFIKEARLMPAARTTPILVLTTDGDSESKMQGKAAGATGWIVKPFSPDQLLAVVARVAA
ncbi:MAG: Chemotaxis protein CheY [Fimbriimonadaceae bacterium]|nr:Chemotaxis protein CheY [Fimbriimonadaceae bacterium]